MKIFFAFITLTTSSGGDFIMTTVLSERVTQIKPSATMAVDSRAKELNAQGLDIINLGVGEPDFDTPDFIKEAAIKAINEGFTKYTAVDGIPSLKDAIIHKLSVDNRLKYTRDQIIVSNGVKHSIYNLTQVLLNAGDEVIIPAPYWVSYPDMVKLAGAIPVFIPTDIKQRFKITPQQLEAAITPKTRLLMINSPSNPSGMAYTADELKSLGEVLKRHPQVVIATDDIYEYILWGMDRFVNILNVCPELNDRTVVFNGVSKAFAMTGWRIGYAAGPQAIINAMKKIQSQNTSNPNSIAQKATVTALMHDRSFFTPMLNAYKERHDLMHKTLNEIKGIHCIASDGTFYLYPNMSEAIARLGLKDDLAMTELLLEKGHVAVVPGSAFGTPGYIRISIATSMDNLQRAIDRMVPLFK